MKDTQLYEQILEVRAPWRVERVTLERDARRIVVDVGLDSGAVWGCPVCQGRMHVRGYERREWRHMDSCQYRTIVRAEAPRVWCPKDGSETVQVPWAEGSSRFTLLFERLAIDVMGECSILGACDILGITWDQADGIKQRAVRRGLARKAASIHSTVCVDEKGIGRGHDYVTVVASVAPGRAAQVEYIGDGRTREALDGYWATLSAEQIEGIEAVGMDMFRGYIESTREALEESEKKIVHDAFHVAQHMNVAVNEVRKEEHRELLKGGDERLKGTRQLWLFGQENLETEQREQLDMLWSRKLRTARAWALKEMLRDFWHSRNVKEAANFFEAWYGWAIRSRLKPVKGVARMLRDHLPNLLTYFVHRLTNAAMEGLNNKIQSLIKKSYGYRNRERFKTDVFFHCGGLDLYPCLSQ